MRHQYTFCGDCESFHYGNCWRSIIGGIVAAAFLVAMILLLAWAVAGLYTGERA